MAGVPEMKPHQAGDMRALIETHKGEIAELARRHRISNVRLFGSVARGESVAGSDVDFLVDLADDGTLFDLAAFRRELEALLGVDVDVVSSRALLPRDDDVLDDAIAL